MWTPSATHPKLDTVMKRVHTVGGEKLGSTKVLGTKMAAKHNPTKDSVHALAIITTG